jgi:hypothetical protein
MDHADYYVSANHETASKFVGQKNLRLIIRQANKLSCSRAKPTTPVDFF